MSLSPTSVKRIITFCSTMPFLEFTYPTRNILLWIMPNTFPNLLHSMKFFTQFFCHHALSPLKLFA